jgi:hypothetical protein
MWFFRSQMMISLFVQTNNIHSKTNNATATHSIAAELNGRSANCGWRRFLWTMFTVEDNHDGNEMQRSQWRLKLVAVKENREGNEMWWTIIKTEIDGCR